MKKLITIAAFLCCFMISGIASAEYCSDVNAYCVKYKTRTTGKTEANLVYYAKTFDEAKKIIKADPVTYDCADTGSIEDAGTGECYCY